MKWGKARKGKWYKRQLNKRKRKYTKLALTHGITNTRGLIYWESAVNYRGT